MTEPSATVHLIEFPSVNDLSGIYFLMKEREVLYVGQSSHVYQRVASHMKEGGIPFTYALWYNIAKDDDLTSVEYFWISVLRPPYNSGRKKIGDLAYYLKGILSDEMLKLIEQIQRETAQVLADLAKRVTTEFSLHQSVASELTEMRQQLYNRLRDENLPKRAAHYLVARFFGWSAWNTSLNNGKISPNEIERLKAQGQARLSIRAATNQPKGVATPLDDPTWPLESCVEDHQK